MEHESSPSDASLNDSASSNDSGNGDLSSSSDSEVEHQPYNVRMQQNYNYDGAIHFERYRMSIEKANELFALVKPHLQQPRHHIDMTARQQFDIVLMLALSLQFHIILGFSVMAHTITRLAM